VEKISGFLSQAHEAIIADDWVRAQNLAEKAGVLSSELVKSLKYPVRCGRAPALLLR